MDTLGICISTILFICVFSLTIKSTQAGDLPCAARKFYNRSVVCVCNDAYCDTVTRELPSAGQYWTYTSSESGMRFEKRFGYLQERSFCKRCTSYVVDATTLGQSIQGFGGAVSDATAINYKSMSENLQQHFIKSYFSKEGLEYNLIRVPIGGSDFSTHGYAYNELPVGDVQLTNFSLAYEDYTFKIPLIKAAMEASSDTINILANIWSPPAWMKTNNNLSGFGQLKPEYYQTLADYHCKFIAAYGAEGIQVWAITTSNEPSHGLTIQTKYACIGWTPSEMGKFIVDNLGETIRKCTNNTVKILSLDDERGMINTWWRQLVMEYPTALDYVYGLGVHFYGDLETPVSILTNFTRDYPGKTLLGTEACQGFGTDDVVALGSWDRAMVYAADILSDLINDVTGWIDWNMALNENGGPNYVENYADAAVIVMADKGEFYKQPMFYAMGHFSKFIPRDSRRVKVTAMKRGAAVTSRVKYVGFLTPQNTIVMEFYNDSEATTIVIKIGEKQAKVKLPSNSITTVEFPNE